MTINSATQDRFYRPLSFNFSIGASISHVFLLKPVVNGLNHMRSRTKVCVPRSNYEVKTSL